MTAAWALEPLAPASACWRGIAAAHRRPKRRRACRCLRRFAKGAGGGPLTWRRLRGLPLAIARAPPGDEAPRASDAAAIELVASVRCWPATLERPAGWAARCRGALASGLHVAHNNGTGRCRNGLGLHAGGGKRPPWPRTWRAGASTASMGRRTQLRLRCEAEHALKVLDAGQQCRHGRNHLAAPVHSFRDDCKRAKVRSTRAARATARW